MKNKDIISSKELQQDLNEERRRKGLKDLPAVNPKNATNTYSRMDKSFSNAFDFFHKMGKKD